MDLRVNSFADDLRAIRAQLDITQKELAQQFGVSLRTLQNWEAGMEPRPRHRRAIRAFIEEQTKESAA